MTARFAVSAGSTARRCEPRQNTPARLTWKGSSDCPRLRPTFCGRVSRFDPQTWQSEFASAAIARAKNRGKVMAPPVNRISPRIAPKHLAMSAERSHWDLVCEHAKSVWVSVSIVKKSLGEAQLQLRLASLERELEQMRSQLVELQSSCEWAFARLRELGNCSGYFVVRDALAAVKEMTKSLYGSRVEILELDDDEIPDDRHFTFRVVDHASQREALSRYNEWHSRLDQVPPEIRSMFRLSVDTRK